MYDQGRHNTKWVKNWKFIVVLSRNRDKASRILDKPQVSSNITPKN